MLSEINLEKFAFVTRTHSLRSLVKCNEASYNVKERFDREEADAVSKCE